MAVIPGTPSNDSLTGTADADTITGTMISSISKVEKISRSRCRAATSPAGVTRESW